MVLSEETLKNGEAVNRKRLENQLPSLDIHVVELLKEDDVVMVNNEGDEEKVSSANQRRRLLGDLLRPPLVRMLPF